MHTVMGSHAYNSLLAHTNYIYNYVFLAEARLVAGRQQHARHHNRLADGEGKHTKREAIRLNFAGRIMRGLKGRAEADMNFRHF